MVRAFLEGYGVNSAITELVDRMDLSFNLVANPDGYQYSHTSKRLWRKTRTPNQGSACVGTDPNRNWKPGWGTVGASKNPCANTYVRKTKAGALTKETTTILSK